MARVGAKGVAKERECEVTGWVKEKEPGVWEAAGAEEGMVHGDVPVGSLGPGLGNDLCEPFLARREGGSRAGEYAVERLQGRGGQSEDGPGGGGDRGGGEDCCPRDVAAGGRRLEESRGLGGPVVGGEGEGELSKVPQ